MGIIIADTSALKARGLAYAFIASPYILTVWAAGPFANSFLNINWRWAFGTWAIVHPVSSIPLAAFLFYHCNKAKKLGLFPERPASGRTAFQSFKFYAIEYDVIGLFLLCAGLAIFLLPFSIVNLQAQGWTTPFIIASKSCFSQALSLRASWRTFANIALNSDCRRRSHPHRFRVVRSVPSTCDDVSCEYLICVNLFTVKDVNDR